MSGLDTQLSSSLTDTLVSALSQCQDQVRLLAEQSSLINNLRNENELLKQELKQLRATPGNDIEARYTAQFQKVFYQVAEKQAEVDRLKEKLRNAKTRARRRTLLEPLSSSQASSATVDPATFQQTLPPLTPPPHSDKVQRNSNTHHHSGVVETSTKVQLKDRKRPRSHSPVGRALKDIDSTLDAGVAQAATVEKCKHKRRSWKDGVLATIPAVAEDGDDHLRRSLELDADQKHNVMPDSVYSRLGNLLEGPGARSPVLPRTQSHSPRRNTKIVPQATSIAPGSPSTGLLTPKTVTRPQRPKSSLSTARKPATPEPEDEEPFRSRPIHRLALGHFRLNPMANSGLDYAYSEVVRGQDRRCLPGCVRECCTGTFRALAATMPNLTSANGTKLSEDEMLQNYLGPDSEKRINGLTPKARENLIHDAKTKLVADAYGKMHRDIHERGRSPPGFWRTDMPGSQEHLEDRNLAKSAEREEVLRRYNEATKAGGRWIFADE